MREDWIECCFEDLLDYEQPTKYIVNSTDYNDAYEIPVLTAGKSFIKGYTNETEGIFENLPTIIFDDFTTASQYVDFKFKVKSSAMKILVPTSKLVNMKFAFYAMQVNQIRNDTHKRYWISVYAKKKFLLPPLVEQKAIISKIEELFSDLDKGIDDLKKAKDQLVIYRQAVLKKAFEGELTKEWREKQNNLLSGDDIFDFIKNERLNNFKLKLMEWDENVEKWDINNIQKDKPKKPRPLDTTVINDWKVKFKTPPFWKLCQLADIISDLTDYHANGSYEKLKENVILSDMPDYAVMIRATNFEKNDFKKDLKYINKQGYDFLSKSKLFGGEILIGKIGNAGRVYYMPFLEQKASLAMNLFALRVDLVSSKFIYYQLKNFHQEQEIRNYVKGVGNPTIDKISIRSIHINLCSIEEQHQIVKEIESRLSICEKVEQSIDDSLEKAIALRQSILKKAFDGKLLSAAEIIRCKQEQDYEPASVLLAKIKAGKKEKIV